MEEIYFITCLHGSIDFSNYHGCKDELHNVIGLKDRAIVNNYDHFSDLIGEYFIQRLVQKMVSTYSILYTEIIWLILQPNCTCLMKYDYSQDFNISVCERKENNCDSRISGKRTGNRIA